jgi:hypothetical protein
LPFYLAPRIVNANSGCQFGPKGVKAIEVKELAEEKAIRLTSMIQVAEVSKQTLQQQVQNLTGMVGCFRNIAANSVNEVLNRLELDLNLSTGG